MPVPTLESQLAMLKSLKRSGVLRTSFEGKLVEYRSMAELNIAIRDLEAEIAQAAGKPRPVARFVTFGRGR